MFFFGIGARGPSPVTGDTCAFFRFVDIYFTVASRFSPTCAVRRGPPAVSHNSSVPFPEDLGELYSHFIPEIGKVPFL